MTENTNDLNTTYDENTESEREHHSHHEHSHHSHSHHSHSHHSHSDHSHSHHSHSHHSHSQTDSYSDSESTATSKKKFSLLNYIRKKSTSRSSKRIPKYRVISQRILFCFILLCFILGSLVGILNNESETANPAAVNTRSETDQLKSQITVLQLEKAALEEELQRYKDIYGELDEDGSK